VSTSLRLLLLFQLYNHQVAAREQYRCAITKDFDFARAMELTVQGKEVPPSHQMRMQAAHIIPFSLNKFNEEKDLVSRIFFIFLTLILWERKMQLTPGTCFKLGQVSTPTSSSDQT